MRKSKRKSSPKFVFKLLNIKKCFTPPHIKTTTNIPNILPGTSERQQKNASIVVTFNKLLMVDGFCYVF